MPKVILHKALQAQLGGLEEVELCDESGNGLGHFLSEKLYRRLLYDWANAQITDEELQRRLDASGGRTLAEIWSRLDDS